MTYSNVVLEVVAEGEGTPLVLLPSAGRDSYDLDSVAEEFANQGFRVLRPQPRGIGSSTGPTESITLHDYAADVAAVIEHEKAGPAIVVGHAFGHYVARMLDADRPDLVRGVVVAAGAERDFAPHLRAVIADSANLELPEEERLTALREGFFAPNSDPTAWLDGWHSDVKVQQLAASDQTDKDEWWAVAHAPILDLQAGADPFRPDASRNELKDRFPELVTVAVIPDTSHALLPENPGAVVEEIVTWAESL
ncbi:alpha/beta fold hydrolase [Rhodococcus sp. NPDC057529]|uniref:alpha/beta fold hydrolase n=1 Tax=Rhodococcus sp. NPDC057529 TaxID=3346158 RepID=UPI0036735947